MQRRTLHQDMHDCRESIRARLREGGIVPGVFVNHSDRRLIEIWAQAGAHFIVIDMEHSTISLTEAEQIIETALYAGLAPLVRAVPQERQTLMRCLDAGAAGIVIPDVRSAQEVREWTEAIAYPPAGTRGLGRVRANNWSISREAIDAQSRPLLVPMIEAPEAIAQIDDLLEIMEVDWFHLGLVDLGRRLIGHPQGEDIDGLVDEIGRKALKAGMPLGFNQTGRLADIHIPPGILCIAAPDRALMLAGARAFTS